MKMRRVEYHEITAQQLPGGAWKATVLNDAGNEYLFPFEVAPHLDGYPSEWAAKEAAAKAMKIDGWEIAEEP